MRRPTLFKKILGAVLLIALVPLLASSLILALNLGSIREKLSSETAAIADRQTAEALRLQAEQVARDVADMLRDCEGDLRLLATLPRNPQVLKSFYDNRQGLVWQRRAGGDSRQGEQRWISRYRSLAFIDASGNETFVIREGRILPRNELRNVSNPRNTEFRSEDFFPRTKALRPGEIHVTHLTGFHVAKDEQLAGAREPEETVAGREYQGVIRFSMPMFDAASRFGGIAILSLDHRHLMEFTQHISPGTGHSVLFPSYKSGNYAFLFDDEGWIITHPKFWDIRGLDREGRPVPPYSERSSPEEVEKGRIPFNLDHAGFVHPNYPVVAHQVRGRDSGYVDITNVGGAKKLMAYAPILYDSGDYRRHGIFGGVTIGFQADQFRETARAGVSLMSRQLRNHLRLSAAIIAITSVFVLIFAWLLSRGITRPLALLTQGARKIADGETGERVEIASADEIGELAADFNRMAEELEQRKQSLLDTLGELRASRREIMAERNFKESILESISSAILTLSPDGLLTSINATGRQMLGRRAGIGIHYGELLPGWDGITERIAAALGGASDYGRRPLVVDHDGQTRHYDAGIFPIAGETSGITVTIRDETEKERLREEMVRLDRFASLGKVSAGIAHEVRNPLTGVSLLLDDLHDRATGDPDSQVLMRKALAEIERVERLVAGLLNFAAPPKADFREGDLNMVAQDTVLLMRRECERHGVTLAFAPGEVPASRFDIEKVKQALMNLVKNALEAMGEGGEIRIETAVEAGSAIISVSDTGPGIPPDDIPLIFEPFFTRKGAGTGLGLSITQRVIEEHHGRIEVQSRPGEGTRFVIHLPISSSE